MGYYADGVKPILIEGSRSVKCLLNIWETLPYFTTIAGCVVKTAILKMNAIAEIYIAYLEPNRNQHSYIIVIVYIYNKINK